VDGSLRDIFRSSGRKFNREPARKRAKVTRCFSCDFELCDCALIIMLAKERRISVCITLFIKTKQINDYKFRFIKTKQINDYKYKYDGFIKFFFNQEFLLLNTVHFVYSKSTCNVISYMGAGAGFRRGESLYTPKSLFIT
jgi:hypothetical protein